MGMGMSVSPQIQQQSIEESKYEVMGTITMRRLLRGAMVVVP